MTEFDRADFYRMNRSTFSDLFRIVGPYAVADSDEYSLVIRHEQIVFDMHMGYGRMSTYGQPWSLELRDIRTRPWDLTDDELRNLIEIRETFQ